MENTATINEPLKADLYFEGHNVRELIAKAEAADRIKGILSWMAHKEAGYCLDEMIDMAKRALKTLNDANKLTGSK